MTPVHVLGRQIVVSASGFALSDHVWIQADVIPGFQGATLHSWDGRSYDVVLHFANVPFYAQLRVPEPEARRIANELGAALAPFANPAAIPPPPAALPVSKDCPQCHSRTVVVIGPTDGITFARDCRCTVCHTAYRQPGSIFTGLLSFLFGT